MKSIITLASDLVAAAKAHGLPESAYAELAATLSDKLLMATTDELLEARQRYESADIMFDDDAQASRVTPGETWVQAWVRVE